MSLPVFAREDGERLMNLALVEHETGGRALLACAAAEAEGCVGRIQRASDVAAEDWRYHVGWRDAMKAVCRWPSEARERVFKGEEASL